jgi:hypothetical protein
MSDRITHDVLLSSVVRNLPELLLAQVSSERRIGIIIEDQKRRYVQFLATEDHGLVVECVSNQFLSEDDQLSQSDEEVLSEIGFASPATSDNRYPNWRWVSAPPADVLEGCRKGALSMSEVLRLRDSDRVSVFELDFPIREHDPDEDDSSSPGE